MVEASPRPLYPRERPGTHYIGGWVGPRAGLDGCGEKSSPIGIRSPDRPARSKSLYRLSYRGSQVNPYTNHKLKDPCPGGKGGRGRGGSWTECTNRMCKAADCFTDQAAVPSSHRLKSESFHAICRLFCVFNQTSNVAVQSIGNIVVRNICKTDCGQTEGVKCSLLVLERS